MVIFLDFVIMIAKKFPFDIPIVHTYFISCSIHWAIADIFASSTIALNFLCCASFLLL